MAYILIVDDDELAAEMASLVLIDAGHACGWVTSGNTALALLQWRRPDLVLLDQNLPGLSGKQVLRELRQSERNYDLPVIMFTAINGAEDEVVALYNGAQDYIRKPFDPRRLLSKVERTLQRRTERPAHLDLRECVARGNGQGREWPPIRRAV